MTELSELVTSATNGNRVAWQALIVRFAPLVTTVGRRLRLSDQDIEDVRQHVWLRMVENLPRLREPAALPGWIVTTARNEAFRILRSRRRLTLVDPTEPGVLDGTVSTEPAAAVMRAEVGMAVRQGLAELQPRQRDLLLVLHSADKVSYHEVSDRLGMPLGSIGPNRARGLDRLRKTAAITRLASV